MSSVKSTEMTQDKLKKMPLEATDSIIEKVTDRKVILLDKCHPRRY